MIPERQRCLDSIARLEALFPGQARVEGGDPRVVLSRLRRGVEQAGWPYDLRRHLATSRSSLSFLRRMAPTPDCLGAVSAFEALCRSLVEDWRPQLTLEIPLADLQSLPEEGLTDFPPELRAAAVAVTGASRTRLADLANDLVTPAFTPDPEQFCVEGEVNYLGWREVRRDGGIVVAEAFADEAGISAATRILSALLTEGGPCFVDIGDACILLDAGILRSSWDFLARRRLDDLIFFPPDARWLMTCFHEGQVCIGTRKVPWKHSIRLPMERGQPDRGASKAGFQP